MHHGGERDAGDPAEQAEQQIFDECLPDQPATSGAERGPDRELAASRGGARELKAGDVRGRRDQQQADRGEHDQNRGPHLLVSASSSGSAPISTGPVLPKTAIVTGLCVSHRAPARGAFGRHLLGADAGAHPPIAWKSG